MPLPKAPSKPADILDDYGTPAKPETERKLPKVRNVMAPAEAAPDEPVKAQKAEEAAKPVVKKKVTLKKKSAAAAPVAAVEAGAPAAAEAKKPAKRVVRKPAKAEKPAEAAAEVAAAPEPAKPVKAGKAEPRKAAKPARKAAAQKEPVKPAEAVKPVEKPAEKAAARAEPKAAVKAPERAPEKKPAAEAPKPAKKLKVIKPVQAEKTSMQSAGDSPRVAAAEKLQRPYMQSTGRKGRALTPEHLAKLFVLDTNVLMHDPLSIFRFAEHDIFLPMTTLEELDNHKKGLTDVARNARTVSRTLDALIEANGGEISQGVPLSLLGNTEASGRVWFETKPMSAELPKELPVFKGDNSILATVEGVQAEFRDRAVVLVSKDINMRIKARTLGIPAEDYFSDKVLDDTDMLWTGKITLPAGFWESVSASLKSWKEGGSTYYAFESEKPSDFPLNACLWIEGDDNFMGMVTDVAGKRVTFRLMKDYRAQSRVKVWGITARNREQNMALNLLMDPEIDFVTLLGQAGTGKTLMTLAAALEQTIDQRRFTEIIMTRATVSVGEDIGFLPGTEEEKMAPWMGALEDNLEVLHSSETGGEWGRQATMDLIRSRIRVKSMSFMRGRTFLQKFVIIDEAQNLSPKQMKTLITRAGPGTKIVCLGNIAQIDTPYLTEGSSGLTYVVERFQNWKHAATITLTRGERSRLAEFASKAL
ncbi:PhoH family protein [Sutterella sp.]|uniref:PhoH family protein n=1 Tax=Sutterella sp. TaxID=1981025 RepID=UPI0026DFD74B|nr:PhoH family protein [Sutterella sp.]MDO5532970.1 PhoH family protein [Sutterella sp.]